MDFKTPFEKNSPDQVAQVLVVFYYYALGRPTILPAEWETWHDLPLNDSDETADVL